MKKINTKRTLLLSVLSLLLCVSMLVGSTFAWFTDSVVSANNIIKSGNLDVVLEYKTKWSDNWAEVTPTTKLFAEDAKFEPGYTEVVFLRVSNAGSLALKYEMSVDILSESTSTNMAGEEFKLSDYLEIGTYVQAEYSSGANYANLLFPTMFGTREAALGSVSGTMQKLTSFTLKPEVVVMPGDDTAQVAVLVLNMPETVGNEANHKTGFAAPKINLGVTLLATQHMAESDSFGPDYDKDAEYPVVVNTAADLKAALTEGGNIQLGADLFVEEKLTVAAGKEVVLDLGGNELTGAFTQQGVSALIQNKGSLTIKNGRVASMATNPDTDWNPEGFPTYASNTISNNGVLVVEDGAVIENQTNVGGASYAIDNYAGATLTVNGGEIKAQDVAIRINTASATAENNVTINGGTITGKRAIWIHIAGSNAAQAPKVNLTINGGDFNSTSDYTIYSYSYGQSFANVNVTIAGGDFEKNVAFGGGYKGDQENVVVTGGTFNGLLGRYVTDTGSGDWVDIAKP